MNLRRRSGRKEGQQGALTLTEYAPIDRETRADKLAPPDAVLISRMAEDDVDALAELFDRYRVPVYRAALALTGDPGASEEVLLDTFGRAYTHRRRLRTDVSPLPWLHKVALNLCYTPPRATPAAQRAGHGDRRRAPCRRRRPAGHERRVVRAVPDRPGGHRRAVREAPVGRDPVLPRGPVPPGDGGRAGAPAGDRQEPNSPCAEGPARPPERRPALRRRMGRGRSPRPSGGPATHDRGPPPAAGTARPWIDFVDRRERGPTTPAALDHLARCERCERGDGGVRVDDRRAAARRPRARGHSRALRRRGAGRPRRRRVRAAGRGGCRSEACFTCAAIVGLVILPRPRRRPRSTQVPCRSDRSGTGGPHGGSCRGTPGGRDPTSGSVAASGDLFRRAIPTA